MRAQILFFLREKEKGGQMNPAVALRERVERIFRRKIEASIDRNPGRPTVLIATVDPEIRESLAGLLEVAPINAIWVRSVEDVKAVIAKERIAACLCGFWLQDGTYREVIRHLRRERIDIPAIIVSAPATPHEYRDYLAAMNLGTLDVLCYPYQKSDFERMLVSAIAAHSPSDGRQSPENNFDFRERGAA
jgi:DNA-binding NtrC family response regulator